MQDPSTPPADAVTVRLSPAILQAVESWAAAQPQPLSRDAAVAAILAEALKEDGFLGGEVRGLRPDELNSANDG